MNESELKNIVEAALLAAGRPLSLDQLLNIFEAEAVPERAALRKVIEQLNADYADRGIEIKQVASGYRLQVKKELAPWVSRLWDEKPARYTRALLETLALVAYRQPITRSEIEDVRGVSVSSNIIKTLLEREWIKLLGHRDVPGRPAMYGTSKEFLDYFNLKSLSDLPSLQELRDIDSINAELDLNDPNAVPPSAEASTGADQDAEPPLAADADSAKPAESEETLH